MHWGEFALKDYSEAVATYRFYFGAITAVSLPGFLSQFGALKNALNNITLGTIVKERWIGDENVLDSFPPTDPMAQRELKWLVICENLTGGNHFRFTIPCPDLSLTKRVPFSGKQVADFTKPEVMAFAVAVEAIVVDPKYGDLDTHITEMVVIGVDT